MNSSQDQGYGFIVGLLAGTVVGAGLALWLVPDSASELRERVTDTARTLGKRASERYEKAGARVGNAVEELTRKGNAIRDDAAESVVRGAHEVGRLATAAKSDATKLRN